MYRYSNGQISLAMRKCGMELVKSKLWETAVHVITMSVLVLNLCEIQCALCQLLAYLLAIFRANGKMGACSVDINI